MGCGCGCNSCGLGRNLDLSIIGGTRRGLGGLGDLVKAGSKVRVGFETALRGDDSAKNYENFIGCLYNSGAWEYVEVSLNPGFFNVYLLVEGVTAIDFGQLDDIRGAVEAALNYCGLPPNLIKGRDRVVLDAPPEEFRGVPGIQQPNPPAREQIKYIERADTAPKDDKRKPDECAIDPKTGKEREGVDYLTCKLGLGFGAGAGTGLVVAIIAAVVIAKAFK